MHWNLDNFPELEADFSLQPHGKKDLSVGAMVVGVGFQYGRVEKSELGLVVFPILPYYQSAWVSKW